MKEIDFTPQKRVLYQGNPYTVIRNPNNGLVEIAEDYVPMGCYDLVGGDRRVVLFSECEPFKDGGSNG